MSFILSKVLWWVVNPAAVLTLLIIAGVVLRRWKPRLGQGLLLAGSLGLVVGLCLPLGEWMTRPLENRFPPAASALAGLERVDGIIVLSGMVSPTMTEDRGLPAVGGNVGRLLEFTALARRFPEARLIFSGGPGELGRPDLSESAVARRVFEQALAVEVERLLFEDRSRNTHENAVFTLELARPQPGERWILVTSAFHMPRAVGSFRAAGWPEMIAVPTDYRTFRHASFSLAPAAGNLGSLSAALHEWIGLAAYRLMGRTDAFFPAPAEEQGP